MVFDTLVDVSANDFADILLVIGVDINIWAGVMLIAPSAPTFLVPLSYAPTDVLTNVWAESVVNIDVLIDV